ncbi:inner membrane protein YpjD [Iodobacter arcticus]|uniref:Inner membrane protein YpjD n=1 Tax=Iodobacter arcticus TaxID=590593 RepID=A0ABW2QSR3_9NEIS
MMTILPEVSPATYLALLALTIYLLLGWHFCRSRLALSRPKSPLSPALEQFILICGLALHASALFPQLLWSSTLHFGAAEALSLSAFATLCIYLSGQLFWKMDGLQPPMLGIAAIFLFISQLLPQGHPITYPLNTLSRGHFLLAMFAHGMLLNAAGVAILMRFADRNLHQAKASSLIRTLPPIMTLERLMFACVHLGFILLTLALLSGIFFAEKVFGHGLVFSHKVILSIAAWLVFGTLLFGRWKHGWRGRFAANWTLFGFSLLFLGYIGSRFVLEALLHRPF